MSDRPVRHRSEFLTASSLALDAEIGDDEEIYGERMDYFAAGFRRAIAWVAGAELPEAVIAEMSRPIRAALEREDVPDAEAVARAAARCGWAEMFDLRST